MLKGYVIIVKNYVAEICEFTTISNITTVDGTKLYYVRTKHGEDYFKEDELSPVRKALEKSCKELNEALRGVYEGSANKAR